MESYTKSKYNSFRRESESGSLRVESFRELRRGLCELVDCEEKDCLHTAL